MVRGLNKNQYPLILMDKKSGIVIDCLEIVILMYPPPREHGPPHCHVKAKYWQKVIGINREVKPEIRLYLEDGSYDFVTHGFSDRDLEIIGETIFNGENDLYLIDLWEYLHGQKKFQT